MSETIQIDAQMGMFTVLKPFREFESIYQGVDRATPIAFPGDLDSNAGDVGYDANLLQGLRVPMGSRVLILIPMTIEDDTIEIGYSYQFVWRIRNPSDVRRDIISGKRPPGPFHLPSAARGRAESGVTPPELFLLPGLSDVEIFEQAEPLTGPAFLNVRQQRYVPQVSPTWVQPLTATGSGGIWQQGAYQGTAANPECSGPTYAPLWLDAAGDDLLILAYKFGGEEGTWNFGASDLAFSNTYGTNNGALPWNPNIGILVSTGSMSP